MLQPPKHPGPAPLAPSHHQQGLVAPLPQVDPVVFNMLNEDPGHVDYSSIGGLSEQIRCGGWVVCMLARVWGARRWG